MAISSPVQVHYRSTFSLTNKQEDGDSWGRIAKMIRSWISPRVASKEGLGGRWYFEGGEWRCPADTRQLLRTRMVLGSGTRQSPQFWAIRFEHPCEDVPARRWRFDLGLTRNSECCFDLSIALGHWLIAGYLGEEPETPVPNAPAIVQWIVDSGAWVATSGAESLRSKAETLAVGDGIRWRDRLESAERGCPLVYVSKDSVAEAPLVDVGRMARSLTGAAVVVTPESRAVDEELSYLLPSAFRCWNGAVRVYLPGVRLSSEEDARRHRFLSALTIREVAPRSAEDRILWSILRRSPTLRHDLLTTIEDVGARDRDLRLAMLRDENRGEGDNELIQLIEEQNRELEEAAKNLRDELRSAQDGLHVAQLDAEERADRIAELERACERERRARINAEVEIAQARARADAFRDLDRLPDSPEEVVRIVSRLHAGKIVFTERALRSVGGASLKDPNVFWQCLTAMAIHLHDLLFGDSEARPDLQEQFKTRSGFELALTETKTTKRDKKLMALRCDTYEGQQIDITPHVKAEGKGRFLRIHFFASHERRLIIVGHCGDHLDTAGTRRL